MNNSVLGALVGNDNATYRVIYYDTEFCILCNINTTKLDLIQYSSLVLDQQIRNNELKIIEENEYVLDYDAMSDEEKKKFENKKLVIDAISKIYGPTYIGLVGKTSKSELNKILEEYSISTPTFWRMIRKYLQSGCRIISLADYRCKSTPIQIKNKRTVKRKLGRPSESIVKGVILNEDVCKQFEEFFKYYKSGREKTYKNAYIGLLDKYYSIVKNGRRVLLSESERPTYRQFYYYCSSRLSKEEKDTIKTSRMETRNANRLLLSSSRKDAIRPGWIVEVDALEVDVSIVSKIYPDQAVGRPIVYFMLDVYSSMIVAASASFENNSMIGLTNLLLNLADDKTEYCRKHGFNTDAEKYWKSNFFPHELRCDRGSDFRSNKFEEICKRLGITRTLQTPGMGSMKGIVEQSFHQFQSSFRPYLEEKGLITQRYDSNHHREAMLDIDSFEQMLIAFILEHNRKSISNYPLSTEMIKDKVVPTPINLWEYGCKKQGAPTPITSANRTQFIFDLMPEANASLSRKGLTYKQLSYINSDPWLLAKMYDLQKKREKFQVRYDPRNVSYIYYIGKNNELCVASLNDGIPHMLDYKDLTWKEYLDLLQEKKELIAKGESDNIEIDYDQHKIYSTIVGSAYSPVLSNTKGLREARKLEKEARNAENSLYSHIDDGKKALPLNDDNNYNNEELILPTDKEDPKVIIKEEPSKTKIEDDEVLDFNDVDFDKALADFFD